MKWLFSIATLTQIEESLREEPPENKEEKELKIKKVLVTGSSGYVGNYLLKKIAKKYK